MLQPLGLGTGRMRPASSTSSLAAAALVASVLEVVCLCPLPLPQELQPQLRSPAQQAGLVLRALELEELEGLLLRVLRAQGLLEVWVLRVLLVLELRVLLAQELRVLLVLLVLCVQGPREPQLRCRLEPQLRGVASRPVAKQTAANESEAAQQGRTATRATSLGTENPHMRAPLSSWGTERRYCGPRCWRAQWCHTSFSSVRSRCRNGATPPRNAFRPPRHTMSAPREHP